MTEEELKKRFKQFAIIIIKMVDQMPKTTSCQAIAKQIVRSGTSPAANYRAACLAKSDKDFINKLKMVQEELDEISFWLEIIIECEMFNKDRVDPLLEENIELLKITNSSIITSKRNSIRLI